MGISVEVGLDEGDCDGIHIKTGADDVGDSVGIEETSCKRSLTTDQRGAAVAFPDKYCIRHRKRILHATE